jgi:hypothetical protein
MSNKKGLLGRVCWQTRSTIQVRALAVLAAAGWEWACR